MTEAERRITPADIMPPSDYAKVRQDWRREIIALKKHRRLPVGPEATLYFENYRTMLQQVQEMLWIEKGGAEQVADELAAYNPLIPQGDELVATLMFEIGDEARRQRVLATLGGVEETVTIEIDGEAVKGQSELGDRVERTSEAGKTSSIHFLHFRFTPAQLTRFRDPAARVVVAIGHQNYAHMAVMPAAVREALAQGFD
jgi:Protein of unknown function (DUF3501)